MGYRLVATDLDGGNADEAVARHLEEVYGHGCCAEPGRSSAARVQ